MLPFQYFSSNGDQFNEKKDIKYVEKSSAYLQTYFSAEFNMLKRKLRPWCSRYNAMQHARRTSILPRRTSKQPMPNLRILFSMTTTTSKENPVLCPVCWGFRLSFPTSSFKEIVSCSDIFALLARQKL
jgi:hypothetical protein